MIPHSIYFCSSVKFIFRDSFRYFSMDSQYVSFGNKTISIIIVMINGTTDLSQNTRIINVYAKINRIHTCTRKIH